MIAEELADKEVVKEKPEEELPSTYTKIGESNWEDYPLIYYPDPILLATAKPVGEDEFGEDMAKFFEIMRDVMLRHSGIGLAAPQIGVSKRIIAVYLEAGYKREHAGITCLINPEIIESSGEVEMEEGCLSFPGVAIKKKRKEKIIVNGRRPDGKWITEEFDGMPSICIQHELDHLDGKTFIDELSQVKRDIIARKIKKLKRKRDKFLKRMEKLGVSPD